MTIEIVQIATRSGQKSLSSIAVVMFYRVIDMQDGDAGSSQTLAEQDVFIPHTHIGREAGGKHLLSWDHESH